MQAARPNIEEKKAGKGNMNAFGGEWTNNNYWASEASGSERYNVNLNNGNLNTNNATNSNNVACSKGVLIARAVS